MDGQQLDYEKSMRWWRIGACQAELVPVPSLGGISEAAGRHKKTEVKHAGCICHLLFTQRGIKRVMETIAKKWTASVGIDRWVERSGLRGWLERHGRHAEGC